MDNYLKQVENLFHEGRWINGSAYIVCKECGALVPSYEDKTHYDWHSIITGIKERINEIR